MSASLRPEPFSGACHGSRDWDWSDWLEWKAPDYSVPLDLMTDPADVLILEDVMIPSSALTSPDRWRAYRHEQNGVFQQLEALRPQLARAVAERMKMLPWKPDQVCLIAHVSVTKVGFAICARNDLHLESELEICVCGRTRSAFVYAHELLHLFGAPDLYFNPWRILTQRGETDESMRSMELGLATSMFERFNALFGNSIMCNPAWLTLWRLTIDPITARAVGWSKPDRQFVKAVEQIDQALAEGFADELEQAGALPPEVR